MKPDSVLDVRKLPVIAYHSEAPLWWGQIGFMAIEGTILALTIATYFYLRMNVPVWPPPGIGLPKLLLPTIGLFVLLVSAIPIYISGDAILKENWSRAKLGTVLNIILSFTFLGLRIAEWRTLGFKWNTNAYGSIFWTILGLHTTHVLADTVETILLGYFLFIGRIGEKQKLGFRMDSLYWYFVVGSWIPLYLVLYIAPYLL